MGLFTHWGAYFSIGTRYATLGAGPEPTFRPGPRYGWVQSKFSMAARSTKVRRRELSESLSSIFHPRIGSAQRIGFVLHFVIFDVDSTLVDSVDLHSRAWQDVLAEFGKKIPFHRIRAQIGKGGDQLLPVFLTADEMARWEKEISARRTKLFRERYLPQVRGFPNVRALFQRILGDGKTIAFASSANGDELQTYKERAQISELIKTETSQDDAEKSKPYPDIFKAALERLGNPPEEQTIVVGDTPYDIEASHKASLEAIAVRCGGFPEETLRGALAIYDGPTDLLAHYDDSPLGGGKTL